MSNSSKIDVTVKQIDKKTGLLKEKPFFTAARKIVKDTSKKWCLISIDIEHFRMFDEWYGRENGDLLLSKIGGLLKDRQDKLNGLAAYFGQDDFVLLCPFDIDKIKRLHKQVRELIVSHGSSVGFSPAFGVVIIEGDMRMVDAYDKASIAASEAKKDIRNRVCVYDTQMKSSAEHEYNVLRQYIRAFKNDEITFYLQPQCRISTGNIVGAESLARWIRKDGSIVPPGEFIPILEKYGFIADLDQRLWDKVCFWLRKWIDAGHTPVPISLNVSRADIFTIDIASHFHNLAEKYQIPHNLLKIEITESVYVETKILIDELVNKLRNDGFLVLMDDFGSGYSSLNMLSNLKVDAIKLDANFLHIEDADHDKGIHILESVVNMAKQIALPIVVEGVETKSQSEFLESLGCRYVQGFYFYRPMPVEQFEALIGDEEKIDKRGFVVKLNEEFRIREFLDRNIYSDSMLNNILGPVALYSWHDGDQVDIVRFNQQFYETVDVPDFHERLSNIERFMIPKDHELLIKCFQEAMDNRLNGASCYVRFYKTNGILTTYHIHFYYLGKKEGGERFYGDANNITELADLKDELNLIASYSNENFILIKYVDDKWTCSVASHSLADIFGLSPQELEKEMNNGSFIKNRMADQKACSSFIEKFRKHVKDNENFDGVLETIDKFGKIQKVKLSFLYVGSEANNVRYLLKTDLVK